MSRYIVDVRVTLDVECDTPEDIDQAVGAVLADIDPLTLEDWHSGDFTVVESTGGSKGHD